MQKSLEVLVAEHDRDVAEGLSDILDMAGHKVHRAFTAEKAYELLRDYDFHIAFLNVKKPGLSNMECFAELRKLKPNARLILMSAHTIDQLTAQITDGGAVKVLHPPFTIASIMDALAENGANGTLLIEGVPADFGAALQSALLERSVNLEIAHDGAEALAKAAEGNLDVLLLDLHQTVVRSLEAFLDLRRQGHIQPTIIFQSYADDGSASNGVLGTDIFYKPFDPAQMVELLNAIAASEEGGIALQAPTAPPAAAPAAPIETGIEAQAPVVPAIPNAGDQVAETTADAGVAVTVSESDAVLTRQEAEVPNPAPADLDALLAGSPPELALGSPEAPAPEALAPEAPSPAPEPPQQYEPAVEPAAPFAPEPDLEPAAPTDTSSDLDTSAPFVDEQPAHDFSQEPHDDAEAAPPAAAAEPWPAPEAPIQAQEPVEPPIQAQEPIEPPIQAQEPIEPPIQAQEPIEPPIQTHEPVEAPIAAASPSPQVEEAPQESQLPAGIGMSAEQLEQAVNEPEPAVPVAGDTAPARRLDAPGRGNGQESRVMVIDDDHDMAEGLAEILDDCGLSVKVAHTSGAALTTLEGFDAHIALVDIQLGRNSGLDLLTDLKNMRPDLIVVMVTAQTDQKSAITALRNGAFDYLNKPLHPQELLAALDRCFDQLAKQTALAAAEETKTDDTVPEEAGSAYMAKLSHKLRTPLNAVVGFSEILSAEMLGPLGSEQYVDYAHDITEAGKSLIDVIDDFEDIDASESGKLEINEDAVDLTRVIFHCLKLIQPAVDAGNLTVEIELAEIPVFMVGDSHKLTQVMLSLLTNAVKFTPSQGKIRFNQYRDEADGIVIDVIDTGVGIAEDVITQALSSVIEGDGDLDPEYEGGGLGLPLATSMAELHGGRLALDSEVGVGTTATLVLPAERNIAPKRSIAV